MSVKSLTVVLDDDGKEVCVLSRTLDGHLTGHGVDLRNFLRGFIIKRGSKSADSQKTVANIGRLAALLIAEFHSGTGEFELRSPGVHEGGQEYVYTVYARHTVPTTPSLLNLRIETAFLSYAEIDPDNGSKTTVIYDGLLDEFDPHEVHDQWSHAQDDLSHGADPKIVHARSTAASASKIQ